MIFLSKLTLSLAIFLGKDTTTQYVKAILGQQIACHVFMTARLIVCRLLLAVASWSIISLTLSFLPYTGVIFVYKYKEKDHNHSPHSLHTKQDKYSLSKQPLLLFL